VLGHDAKRLHLFHELHRSDDDALIATGEHMLLHVDASAGRAAPARTDVLARLAEIAAAQTGVPAPEGAGRRIEGERLAPGAALP
jgi:hypothetical protein